MRSGLLDAQEAVEYLNVSWILFGQLQERGDIVAYGMEDGVTIMYHEKNLDDVAAKLRREQTDHK